MKPLALARVRVVLSRPSHPGNIGAAARAMKTMGMDELYLVRPKRFPDPEADARASGASDVLARAVVCETLAEALADTHFAAAMTARRRDLAAPFCWAREGAGRVMAAASATADARAALVFGNETHGLSNEELAACQLPVMIPADAAYPSLNLGAAVQVMCYELRLAAEHPGAPPRVPTTPASLAELEDFYAHLERAAIASGFLDPGSPKRLMPRMRRLFGRAGLEREEVSILRGLLAALESPKWRRPTRGKNGDES